MRYVKVRGLTEKKDLKGYYSSERNLIVVDFSRGLLQAVWTSFHEALHKILDVLGVEDWLDLFDPLMRLSNLKNPKRWLELFAAVFFTEPQVYYPIDDEQRIIPVEYCSDYDHHCPP